MSTISTPLLPLALDFLESEGYAESARTLEAEAEARGVKYKRFKQTHEAPSLVVESMMSAFDVGNGRKFMKEWTNAIDVALRDGDETCIKLEAYVNIYFAIVGMHPGVKSSVENYDQMEAMQHLQAYLNNLGTSKKYTPQELLPFFALPVLADPMSNSSFSHLFSETWVNEIRGRVEAFLRQNTKAVTSKLSNIVAEWEVSTQRGRAAKGLEGIKRELNHVVEERNELWQRHQQLQREYYNLLGITDELVEAVLSGIQGKPISHLAVAELCSRLNSFTSETQLTSRPTLEQERPTQEGIVADVAIQYPLPALDFVKVKHILATADEEQKALVLQALRWRITRSLPGEQRNAVLVSYIENDLCDVSSPSGDGVIALACNSKNDVVQENAARLLSVVSSLSAGRAYLSYENVISQLVTYCKVSFSNDAISVRSETEEEGDTRTQQLLVSVLQKLSLRKANLRELIDLGVIDWITEVLSLSSDSISDVTTEFIVALFMNLCLTQAGKTHCAKNGEQIISTLLDLLGHDNPELSTYVNACFYSLLSRRSIRDQAFNMGAADALKAQMNVSEDIIAEQLAHVLDNLYIDTDDSDQVDDEDEDDGNDDGESDSEAHVEMMLLDFEEREPVRGNKNHEGEHVLQSLYEDKTMVYEGLMQQETTVLVNKETDVRIQSNPVPSKAVTFSRPQSTASRPKSTRSSRGSRMGTPQAGVDILRKSTAKLSQALADIEDESKKNDEKNEGREQDESDPQSAVSESDIFEKDSKGDDGDGDGDGEEREPPQPVIDEKASGMLGKQVSQASEEEKLDPPKNVQEGDNLDEYYTVFATRPKLARD
eukprot:m.74572 g.74572  ORF g.74572 m.74572 type:complete len:829 (+) comp8454_c0_seq4:136-2622(+)